MDANQPPASEEETISRLQAAYDAFVVELEALRQERLELAKRVVGRIEAHKIKEVLDSLRG